MTKITDLHKRPLPSFVQWLETASPDTKAPDFAAFEDLARRTQAQSLDQLKPHEASFARIWMGACIAAVELANMEALKHKRPNGEIVALLPRAFACATMYAIASVCKQDTPYRAISKIVSEEFRAAAKLCADTLESENNHSYSDGDLPTRPDYPR